MLLEKIIEQLSYNNNFVEYDDKDFTYFEEIFSGFKLENRDGKLVLIIYRDNLPGKDISAVNWPGTEDDYKVFIKWLDDGLDIESVIPHLVILLIQKEKELMKLRDIKD